MWSLGLAFHRLLPFLLASSSSPPPTSTTHTSAAPRRPQDLARNFEQLYRDLERPGAIHRQVTPTLRFSHVSPPTANGTSTWKLPDAQQQQKQQKYEGNSTSGDKPIAVYLPGLDGYGISASEYQFDDLATTFDLWRLTVQPDDRSSLMEAVTAIANFIRDELDKPVVLIGESSGGLLAAATALKLKKDDTECIQGLVLVNPATSFDRTVWDRILPLITSLQYLERQPEHSSPSNLQQDETLSPYSVGGSLLLSAIVPDSDQFRRIVDMIANLEELDIPPSSPQQVQDVIEATIDGFRETGQRLPASILQHRADWLMAGTEVVNARLNELKDLPTLIVAGQDDKLLPSVQEADRLVEALPGSEKLVVQGRGHFVLDQNVNLTEAILYSKIDPLHWSKKKAYDPILDWQLPGPEKIKKAIDAQVNLPRTLQSPVFFSTDKKGKRWKGLGKIPRTEGPLLFVGNHQFAALDMAPLVAELYEKRGIFPRGLAHPITFFQSNGKPSELHGRTPGIMDNGIPPGFNTLQEFGAVEVSPRNYYKVLQSGQDALLFPGGAKEALSRRTDYPLFWPSKVDFVRTAAKFNATIIPFSAVGIVDSVNVLLEPEELASLPFIGDRARANANVSAARYDEENEVIGFPLALPKVPARLYFLFGKPISLNDIDPKDKAACKRIYEEAQSEVRRGLDDILRAREHDPFLNTPRRLAYERVFSKTAPTFPIDELNR